MERRGLRLQLMKQQAKAGDIVLLFADESEALTHPHPSPGLLVSLHVQADRVKGSPYLARAWAKRGADLRVPAPGQAQNIAMMGALDFVSRERIVETSRDLAQRLVVLRPGATTASPSSRGCPQDFLADVIALLERLDQIHGPRPLSRIALFPPGAIRERVIASPRPLSRIALFPSGAIRERVIASPRPETVGKPVTIVVDNGPVHTSKATRAALARAHWLTPEWLPKYAPALNAIEREWKTLKADHLADKTFKTGDSLKAAIGADIKSINSHRKTQVLAKPRIAA